jgi:hypothetical protein
MSTALDKDLVKELLKWSSDRREQAASELANRVAAEKSNGEALDQAEKNLKEIETARELAQAEIERPGATVEQAARDRLTALSQQENTVRAAVTSARIAYSQATADRKAAEAVDKVREDCNQDLLNTLRPRVALTLGKGIRWAFSGERWPQVLTSLVVLLSMWFVWGSMGEQIAKTEFARGMITLLFGVGTIMIALVLTLTAILQTGMTAEDRFKYGMQILTVLIGVFGTILGFYFGSANKTEGTQPASPVSVPADAKAKADADAKIKADAKAKADADAKIKAVADAKNQADANAKADADAKNKAEATRK